MQSWIRIALLLSGMIVKAVLTKTDGKGFKILDKKPVDIIKFPFMVQVSSKTSCGGIIISEEYVLTAACCAEKVKSLQVGSAGWGGIEGVKYNVSKVIKHADYDSKMLHANIALLKIKGKFTFTSRVKPAKLATDKEDKSVSIGNHEIIVGWRHEPLIVGKLDIHYLKCERVPIRKNEECEVLPLLKLRKNEICTKINITGLYAAPGSALVLESSNKVIGLASHTFHKEGYIMYSRISHYRTWIKQKSGV